MSIKPLAAATAAVVLSSAAALAQDPVVTGITGGTPFGSFYGLDSPSGDTVGYTFTANEPLLIGSLGVYAADVVPDAEGLSSPHEVGLWDATSQTLLGSVTVSPGDTVIGDFAYAELDTPVPLVAGSQYLLGALYFSDDDDTYLSNASPTLDGISNTQAVFPASADLGFAFPTSASSGNAGRFGPNALAVIPEPTSLGLIALGGLAMIRRR